VIKVKKASEHNTVETTDVKGLSGGERSFTTLCLLLALGEKLETPFRILDEYVSELDDTSPTSVEDALTTFAHFASLILRFDVFLDTSARRLVMQMLIFTAKKLKHRQFIFITPQDISGLKADPMVRIHKLQPPVRHGLVGGPTQQTLNFSSQGSE